MAVRKRTLRRMTPQTRKFHKLCNELESVQKRLKNFGTEIADLESWAEAAKNSSDYRREVLQEALDALEALVHEYWMNKGSDGTFPTPHEFIACITPSGIPDYWRKADAVLAKAKKRGLR